MATNSLWLLAGISLFSVVQGNDVAPQCKQDPSGKRVCLDEHTSLIQAITKVKKGSKEADPVNLLSVQRAQVTASSDGAAREYSMAMQQSQEIHRNLMLAAKSMPESTTKSLFEQFRVCGQCDNFERFGERHDGGYLMCMDGLHKGKVKAAYSLGVEQHDQWSEDVVKALGLVVNQFDCTVEESSCEGCKFFKKCIVSADGLNPVPGHESEGWSLEQALAETSQGNAADGSLLMKMDIEASEWPIYMSEPPKNLKKFGQLIVEFHWLGLDYKHAEYLQAMKNIKAAGFQVAHLHGNNYDGMYKSGDYKIPNVLEVTFVQSAARPGGCDGDQDYKPGLDATNDRTAPELPMVHVP